MVELPRSNQIRKHWRNCVLHPRKSTISKEIELKVAKDDEDYNYDEDEKEEKVDDD